MSEWSGLQLFSWCRGLGRLQRNSRFRSLTSFTTTVFQSGLAPYSDRPAALGGRPWLNFPFFFLPILLFFSTQIFYPFYFLLYPFCFLSHPFCFSSSHVELINGVQYLERSKWHCGCTWHWNAVSGHLNQQCLFCQLAILDSPFC